MPRDLLPSNVRDFTQESDRGIIVIDAPFSDAEREEFITRAKELVLIREQKARLVAKEDEAKKYLMTMLERAGEPYGSANQHRMFKLPQAYRDIIRIVRQTKVIQDVDLVLAEATARQRGLYEQWFPPRPTLDDTAVMVSLEQNLITDEEFQEIFPKRNQYSLTLEKKKR